MDDIKQGTNRVAVLDADTLRENYNLRKRLDASPVTPAGPAVTVGVVMLDKDGKYLGTGKLIEKDGKTIALGADDKPLNPNIVKTISAAVDDGKGGTKDQTFAVKDGGEITVPAGMKITGLNPTAPTR